MSRSVSQIISLPKGGGALHSIGETFAPDLHTGTGNFTIPIALPPGRNGHQPQLSLAYSTGAGNGPFGLGWNLSVPGISRKTSKGIPRYEDLRDIFILSGAEDLVPISDPNAQVTRYRPRTEGLFARIEHRRDAAAGSDFWEVRGKDGLVSYYGTPRLSGSPLGWRDPAAIGDPARHDHIFAWKLTSTSDPFGNRIEYQYRRDTTQSDGPHRWDQLYLSEIRYADFDDPASPAGPQFLVTVRFSYRERPDPFSEYRAGFELRTALRCSTIEIFTHARPNTLVRRYQLIYLDERGLPDDQLPPNCASLLSQIQVTGHDGDAVEALPPLEFGYTRFEPGRRTFLPIGGAELPSASLANPDYDLVDLFGNGLPDILEMSGTVRYWRNLGGGAFDRPREMRDAPGGLRLGDPGIQMLDANGDGRPDLMVTSNGMAGYFPLRFDGAWDRRSFQRYRTAPSFSLRDPEVRLVDMDGDGVTDAIRSGSRLECFFNDPQLGWNATRTAERQALDVFPNVNFSDPRVKWADMSGDGLQDIALVSDGAVEYWPNLGYGRWGKLIRMRNSPRLPYGYDPKRILVGDVDGDGLADIVCVDHGKVTLWINQSGNSWSDPIVITGTPVTDGDSVRLADVHGSGIGGVLWSTDASGLQRRSLWFLDFTGGAKPYLLHEMNNHLGALTRVDYAPSTHYYLEDQQRPATRWRTPLPFPVQVVARVEVIDALSRGKLTTEYTYHHGYWDGAEREFRGFGMVEQRDTETFDHYHADGLHGRRDSFADVAPRHFAPPTLTRTWFHQGPVGAEFGDWQELDWSGEYWPGDPQQLRHTESVDAFLKQLGADPSPRARRMQRDALRALRGSILRTELYALDGDAHQDRPYTVTESAYGLREESPPGPGDDERPRMFFPHQTAQRTTQWERGDDPLTRITFTGDYDAYGQPRTQTSVACPRGWRDMDHATGGYLATRTITSYAESADPRDIYIHNRVASVTTYEILDTGARTATAIRDLATDDPTLKVVGNTHSFYDGPAFEGLPNGQIGDYGALARAESLVLTEDILREAYAGADSAVVPPYLTPGPAPAWTDEYPVKFRALLPVLAGYRFDPGADPSEVRGFYVQTERRRYDFHESPDGRGHGLMVSRRDPLGRDTAIAYDRFALLPILVADAAGLTTTAEYDYRVFQPAQVIDPNGNRNAFAFSPLGLLHSAAVMGKAGEDLGDTMALPGTRLTYDFGAFADRGEPIWVRTIRRVHHANDVDAPVSERDATIESVEYSDGFGRLLQTRTQAEDVVFGDPAFGGGVLPADQRDADGPRRAIAGIRNADTEATNVVVSGWQIYDNKGRVVEKYEPFFATGWGYAAPGDAELGQKATMFYDPRGQMIRTINPDGSEQRVVYGVPADLDDPTLFRPTPWETYTYDANDNAGRTHPKGSAGYQSHWNTPASIELDALGRTIAATTRNGHYPAADWYVTRSTYDILGNLLTVTDALGRVAFAHVYDLAQQPLRIESIDAGVRHIVLDAAGSVVEQRDGKGALVLHAYDTLSRPIRLWARDAAGEPVTLRERLLYGDDPRLDMSPEETRARNLLGKLYRHDDEAGRLICNAYDFKGNLLEKSRRVIDDAALLATLKTRQGAPFRIDWDADRAEQLLEDDKHHTTTSYDALSRVKSIHYPRDASGKRKLLHPRYNRAGALERVELENTVYVERIAYNAKGQRTLIAYGNGLMTRYAYDEATFRLARLRTERYTKPNESTYQPDGGPLQDYAYAYDLAGNIVTIVDRAPGSGVLNNPDAARYADSDPEFAQLITCGDALVRAFAYDPLYRLVSADGREHARPAAKPPWLDVIRAQDPKKTRLYTQQYQYDSVGNIVRSGHAAQNNTFNRDFGLAPGSNRLQSLTIGKARYDYAYDANGNLVRENGERHFEWDHADRLRSFRVQAEGADASVHALYLYDAAGQRVKKLVRKQGGAYEVTIYIDGIFEHHRRVQGDTTRENDTLHIMDNRSRIALLRVGAAFPDDRGPALQFHLGDHLGSSNLVIDGGGAWVNREEHTPYGETCFGGFARKRYRFTGKERDEESGLNYHGARYYAPWVGRWVSCDPKGMVDGVNLYAYARHNPLRLVDQTGTDSTSAEEQQGDQNNVQINTQNFAYDAKQVITATNIPVGPSSEKLSGPFKLWSRPEGLQQANATKGGFVLDQTKLGQEAIRRAEGLSDVESFSIFNYTSYKAARQSTLAEMSVENNGPSPRGSIKTETEIPTVQRFGALMGGLTGASGGILAWNALHSDNETVARLGVASGLAEMQGGMLYIVGSRSVNGTIMTLGRNVAKVGGGVGNTVVSGYALYRDYQRGDIRSGVGDAAGLVGGVATLVGAAPVAAVAGTFGVAYSLTTQVYEYSSESTKDTLARVVGAPLYKAAHMFGFFKD